jgi:hypothetical protein
MHVPTDFWAKIGHAESIIRCAMRDTAGWPPDITISEHHKLERIMEDLHQILAVGVK